MTRPPSLARLPLAHPKRRPVLLCTVLAFLLFIQGFAALPAHAQSTYSSSYSFGVPGNTTFGQGGTSVDIEAGATSSMGGSFMGCAGIGQFTFILSALNTSTLVDQLIQFGETMLAKFALGLLFSFPQVQAMMDMLNAIGNFKFQLMQQSCDINTLRKEGKDMYLQRCMGGDQTKIGACESSWSDGSFASSSAMQAINQLLCKAEGVTDTVRTTICPTGSSCMTMLFMPQVKINLGGTGLGCGSQPNQYGTHSAPVSFSSLFNSLASTLGVSTPSGGTPIMLNLDQAFTKAAANTTQAQRDNALAETEKRCTADPLLCQGTDTKSGSTYQNYSPSGDDGQLIVDFKNRISCPNPDSIPSFNRIQAYFDELSKATNGTAGSSAAGAISLNSIDGQISPAIQSMVSNLGSTLNSAYSGDTALLNQLIEIAARCSLNDVDLFDIKKRNALEKQGRAAVEADVTADAIIWSGMITNMVAKFTIDIAEGATASLLANKAQANTSVTGHQTGVGSIPAPNASNPTMQDTIGNDKAAVAFKAAIQRLKAELAAMNEKLKNQKDYSRYVQGMLDKTSL